MIFITLGTQPCDFSRFLRMVETMLDECLIEEPIIAQIGHTQYRPAGVECFKFVSEQEYQEYLSQARVVISHAGTGALFGALKKEKLVIAVARLQKYGEMVDNHQEEIVLKLAQDGYLLDGTQSILNAWLSIDNFKPKKLTLHNDLPSIIESQIRNWLDE